MSSHWHHCLHHAHREDQRGNHKAAAIVYIIVGFFFAPILIGIPLLHYGVYKLSK